MPARARELKARSVKKASRPRDTGPTATTRALVVDRADGRCEVCTKRLHVDGRWVEAHSLHHRRARGMGGTTRPDTNSPANLLLVCGTGTTGCHGWIESNRTESRILGYLVSQSGHPDLVVVELADHRHVTLAHDGTYREAS